MVRLADTDQADNMIQRAVDSLPAAVAGTDDTQIGRPVHEYGGRKEVRVEAADASACVEAVGVLMRRGTGDRRRGAELAPAAHVDDAVGDQQAGPYEVDLGG